MIKCPECGSKIFPEMPLFWNEEETADNLILVVRTCKEIFKLYPEAIIRELFHNPDECIIHFNALGGYGSDSVCISSDGSWHQFLSGDLGLSDLDKLERRLRPIFAGYHSRRVEIRIAWGMHQLFGGKLE